VLVYAKSGGGGYTQRKLFCVLNGIFSFTLHTLLNLNYFKYYCSICELIAYLSIIYFGESVVNSSSLNCQIEASIIQVCTHRNLLIYFKFNLIRS